MDEANWATAPSPTAAHSGRNVTSGALFGVGVAAFVDETVFHQLLHWHHFYDKSTLEIGLVSDGLFHAFGWLAAVSGMFLFADLRRRSGFRRTRWVAGLLVGLGSFQLYDGVVQHKLMKLHQIRYGVDPLPYDLTWNLIAVALLVAGIVALVRTRPGRPSG